MDKIFDGDTKAHEAALSAMHSMNGSMDEVYVGHHSQNDIPRRNVRLSGNIKHSDSPDNYFEFNGASPDDYTPEFD